MKGLLLQEELEIMPDLLKSVLNYSKKYVYKQIYTILKEWSMDDLIEENQFPKNGS